MNWASSQTNAPHNQGRILDVLTIPTLPRHDAGWDGGEAEHTLTPVYHTLRQALAGERTLLPVPAEDPHRRTALLAAMRPGEPINPEVALVVATSGSTGTPKGAQLGVAGLNASITATHQALGGEGRWMLTLPAHHIAGVQVITRSLACGYEPIVMPAGRGESFVRRFVQTVEAAQHEGRAPRYCSLVPTQLESLCAAAGQGREHSTETRSAHVVPGEGIAVQRVIDAVAAFDAVLVGGAATPPALLQRAHALGWRTVTTYGSSETCGGVVYNQLPIPGSRVAILALGADGPAATSNPPEGFTAENPGRIWLGGPTIALGYRNVASADFHAAGWYRTNDLGFLDSDGKLHVVGRADAIINSGSVKVLPGVVEEAARRGGLPVVLVCGVPSPRWGESVCLVVQDDEAATPRALTPAELGDLRSTLAPLLPRHALPTAAVAVAEVPMLNGMKLDRAALIRQAREAVSSAR